MGGDAVAVVGMGLAVPGATSPEAFWKLLDQGAELLSDPPADRWDMADFAGEDDPDKTYQQTGGFITELAGTGTDDLAQAWLRHCLGQALDGVARAPGDRFSLCLGYTADASLHQERALLRDEVARLDPGAAGHFEGLGEAGSYLPHRMVPAAMAGFLPGDTRVHLIDTACSSSLYAIDVGLREVQAGAADVAVCGGLGLVTPSVLVLFAKTGGLPRSARVRSLDAGADGVLFSDGAGLVVLKRLDRALADGDQVHGLLLGAGVSADGRGTSIYAPSAAGQRRAITRALARSGVAAHEVGLIVAHATGTRVGDAVELSALSAAYDKGVVVSNKSLLGHTTWAAGVLSLIHALLALQHERIPAQYGLHEPAPAGGLTIPAGSVDWPADADGPPRTAAVCGAGFGGTNAHLLVREYRPGDPIPSAPPGPPDELVLVGWASKLPDAYSPLPAPDELRLPAPTLRRLDSTQLMLVQCMHQLDPAVRATCRTRADRTGVVVGHCGPTRSALLYRMRAHLDELNRLLGRPALTDLRDRIPPPNQHSYPGQLPNIIAGRLSNEFDLRGLNMTVDQGEASLAEAFEIASRYVRSGDLEVALIGAASGNSLPSFQDAFSERPISEGAFLFAMTTRRVAEADGLPVLAAVDLTDAGEPARESAAVTFAGAEGGPELAAFLAGDAEAIRTGRLSLRRERPAALERYELSLAADPRRAVRPPLELFPPGTTVVTNIPGLPVPAGAGPSHLRIVVDLEGDDVLRTHDAMFTAVQAAGTCDSILVLVLGTAERHPLAALFTGFVKGIAQEMSSPLILAVVHDGELDEALADLEAETAAAHRLPVVHYIGGERRTVRAVRKRATPGSLPLTRDSVVVAAGGGRGIGAEVLKELARRTAPRIVVLGTTRPEDSVDAGRQIAAGRAAFIRSGGWATVKEATEAFDRLVRAQEVHATLAELAGLCDPDRVEYHVCDLRDTDAVARVVARVPDTDLLLNVAGIGRTAEIGRKPLADFTAVRDFKVTVHANLVAAFGDRRPRIWCNFGSYAGFFGVPGDADYCASNDFLVAAAACDADEYTIGFGRWQDAGFDSGPLRSSFQAHTGRFTPMTTAEGVGHFMAELTAAGRPTATVQLGPRERAAIEESAPGYFAWCEGVPGFFLDEIEELTSDRLTAVRVFDLDRDGYLVQHLIDGHPTLPGLFYVEVAAQAALRLAPDRVPAVFENLDLAAFLRVYGPDRPHRVRITARLRSPDRVHVRVTSDVVAPGGRVLVRDRLHASLDVLLHDRVPSAPEWRPWDDATAGELVSPYTAGSPAARLTGLFAASGRARLHPRGRRARLAVDRAELDRWFLPLATPIVELDGLAQLAGAQPAGGQAVVQVPSRIARIELSDQPADGPLELYEDSSALTAVSAAGRVVARITGYRTAVIGQPVHDELQKGGRPC